MEHAEQAFGPMVARLRALSAKPLPLTETASSSSMPGAVNVAAKSQWITQLFGYATASTSGARMIVWFNEDKETDWAVFGGTNGDETYRSGRTSYKADKAYRAAVQPANLLSPNPRRPEPDERRVLRGFLVAARLPSARHGIIAPAALMAWRMRP